MPIESRINAFSANCSDTKKHSLDNTSILKASHFSQVSVSWGSVLQTDIPVSDATNAGES